MIRELIFIGLIIWYFVASYLFSKLCGFKPFDRKAEDKEE